ncbi:MAG: hypothetical protein EOO36_06150, partial [Cytophagaceae bacterium]
MPSPTLAKPKAKSAATPKPAPAKKQTITSTSAVSVPASATPVREGFGALPHAGGTTFRVWAPAATAVSVIGTFNDWNK